MAARFGPDARATTGKLIIPSPIKSGKIIAGILSAQLPANSINFVPESCTDIKEIR
jgi:hypothetical protein